MYIETTPNNGMVQFRYQNNPDYDGKVIDLANLKQDMVVKLTLTDGVWSADHTYADIAQAIANGVLVRITDETNDRYAVMGGYSDNSYSFVTNDADNCFAYTVTNENVWSLREVLEDESVFFATYGTTTLSEIRAADADGKLVVCKDGDGVVLILTFVTSSVARFAGIVAFPDTEGHYAACSSTNVWSSGVFRIEDCYAATYGTTTYTEVVRQAEDLGKVIFCNYDGLTYYLTGRGNVQDLTLVFTAIEGTNLKTLSLSSSSVWSNASRSLLVEIANNLTTDDATKALSAAQGVVLEGEIGQLGQEVNGYEFSDDFNITTTGEHSSNNDRLSFSPVIPKGTYIFLIETGTSGNAGIVGLYPHYVGDSGNTNLGTLYINVPTQVTLAKDMDSLGLYMSATVNTGTGTMPLTIRSVNSVAQTLDKLSDYEELKKEVTGSYSLQFPINGNSRLNQAVPLGFTGKCRAIMRVISGTDTWKWQLFRNINGTKGEALTGEINLGSSVDIEIPSTDSGVWAYSVAGSVTVGRIYELAFTQIEQTLNGEVGDVRGLAEENHADINKQEAQATLTSVHTSSSRYMAVANGGAFTASSSGAAVNFYKITKDRKYIISAPKGVNSACYGLAYANVIGDNLAGAQVYEFADTVGTSAEPFNYTINAAGDYGYLCVGYIAANGQPTVTEVSMSYRFALEDANEGKAKIRMLCFGNSFTQDSVNYAPFILKGIYPECELNICMAIIGGSPLAQHCANITGVAQSDGTNTYQPGVKYNIFYYHNGSSVWEEGSQLTATELLQMEAWDIVTFQQGGQVNYGNYNTYYQPFLNSTFKALNGILTNPYRIGWLLTHGAYDTTAEGVLSHWEGSKDNTELLLENTPVSVLFPYGTAIQNLRTTPIAVGAYGAGILQADTAHLQEGIPTLCASYSIVLGLLDVAGVNWKGVMGDQTRPDYAWITGHNCPGTNYATPGVVEGITEENCYLAQFAATAAKEHPFVVTPIS